MHLSVEQAFGRTSEVRILLSAHRKEIMERKPIHSSSEHADHISEIITVGEIGIIVTRTLDGLLQNVQPVIRNSTREFHQIDERTMSFQEDKNSIVLETQPPNGLSRENSGHPPLPLERQMWVIDITSGEESMAFTIPLIQSSSDTPFGFSAEENEATRQHPLIPFSLSLTHPESNTPKTEILEMSQIFGHISAAARLLEAMPHGLRAKTRIAARNIENVPRVVEHMKSMDLGKEGFMVPLVYDDSASGGSHIQERRSALWWLIQNPELIDQFVSTKIIISDLREETALLKQIADTMNLPQFFIGLTCSWPQRLNTVEGLHPELQHATSRIPSTQQKVEAMRVVGLEEDDAVVDWFEWARQWKGGVRENHAHSTDLLLDFSLVDESIRPVTANNILVLPPRTHLSSNTHIEEKWVVGKKRLLVMMGSGDWTERELFTERMTQAAQSLPDCDFIVVGPTPTSPSSSNIHFIGYVPPSDVDGLIQSCDIAIIKPGHFSLEETAGKLTLVAPPDNLEHSVTISRQRRNPRSVAISVEVDEERLSTATEAWLAMGSPSDFCPLLDLSSPNLLAKQITHALQERDRFAKHLQKIPRRGTEQLVAILEGLTQTHTTRDKVVQIVQRIIGTSIRR